MHYPGCKYALRIDNRRQSVIHAILLSFLDIACTISYYASKNSLVFSLSNHINDIKIIHGFEEKII